MTTALPAVSKSNRWSCKQSVFFWSEEHARAFRTEADYIDGRSYTLEQSAYATRIFQSALFPFT
jgi:hypothetical protein